MRSTAKHGALAYEEECNKAKAAEKAKHEWRLPRCQCGAPPRCKTHALADKYVTRDGKPPVEDEVERLPRSLRRRL